METTKSVLAGIRPRSLFASAAPVLIALAQLPTTHGINVFRIDAACAVAVAVMVQMLANLNGVYSTFHRALNPFASSAASGGKDNKIVINLLSQKLLRMCSWLLFVAIIVLLGVVHISNRRVELPTTCALVALAVASFLYCRHNKPLPIPGIQELIFSLAIGPVAMAATAKVLVNTVPLSVVLYSLAIMFFALAFQVLQSTVDAPFARRLGNGASSLAMALGYERAFQAFIVCITGAYGLLVVSGIALGHLPNLVLVATMSTVREICDAFREEQLKDLPDRLAHLGAQLSAGVMLSITISSLLW